LDGGPKTAKQLAVVSSELHTPPSVRAFFSSRSNSRTTNVPAITPQESRLIIGITLKRLHLVKSTCERNLLALLAFAFARATHEPFFHAPIK